MLAIFVILSEMAGQKQLHRKGRCCVARTAQIVLILEQPCIAMFDALAERDL
jgi:hypothetical protein